MLLPIRRSGEHFILETTDGPIEVVLRSIDSQQAAGFRQVSTRCGPLLVAAETSASANSGRSL